MNNQNLQRHNNNRGAALLLFVVFFLFASIALTYILSKSFYADLLSHRLLFNSKESYLIAESSLEDVAYRYITGKKVGLSEVFTINNAVATTTAVLDTFNGILDLSTIANDNGAIRKVTLKLIIASGAAFNFGVQTGNGGFQMANSAQVIGNVFSNGAIIGGGSSVVNGDVISAGPTGLVDGIHATGSVRSHSIGPTRTTLVEGDAYYQLIDLSNTTVWGAKFSGSPDEATSSLPFPDSKVDAHKATVTSDGTVIASTDPECAGGTYTIDTNTTLGLVKIECNVTVSKNSTTLTLTDTVWITGNLTFSQGPTVEAIPAIATTSVLVIVDNESDRITSSAIDIANGTIFSAPSSPKSYIMLVSMNNDAENSGTNDAVTMGQSSNGDVIVYAGHGKISLGNSIYLKEVTGYLISMGNSSTIEYESGLINLNFTSGPSGGFELGKWKEVE